MIRDGDLEDRHVLPRWLPIWQSQASGELNSATLSIRNPQRRELADHLDQVSRQQFKRTKERWVASRNIHDAEDLVSVDGKASM